MNLTQTQIQSIRAGQPVRMVAPELGDECVIVRADVFDRLKNVLYDDSPLSQSEKSRLLLEAGLRAGWDDPEMDVYNAALAL